MNVKWRMIGYILKTYAKESRALRLFILIRYLVCPWQKVLSPLPLARGKGKLLDIGCGHGLFLHLIRLENGGWTLSGMDHDGAKILTARRSVPKDTRMTFMDTPRELLPDEQFDCITLVDVLYAVEPAQWGHIWELIHRHLTADGVLLIKETVNQPRFKYWFCLLQEIAATRILKYTKGHAPFLPSFQYYLETLVHNGFEVIEHRRVDQGYLWPHYIFVAERSKRAGSKQ